MASEDAGAWRRPRRHQQQRLRHRPGLAYTGTAPNLAPVATFYNDSVFGRNVYNVFDTARVTGFGNDDIKSVFVGPTSALCSARAEETVGRPSATLTAANCGSTTLTGSLLSGIQ